MKAIDIRQMTTEELANGLEQTQQELFNLRLQESLGQLEKPSRIKQLRRDIARYKTVMTARKKEAATPAAAAEPSTAATATEK